MKRVEVHYQGRIYSVADSTLEAVRETVDQALRGVGSHWLSVHNGEGLGQEASILITPGIAISVVDPTPAGTSDLTQAVPDDGGLLPDLI